KIRRRKNIFNIHFALLRKAVRSPAFRRKGRMQIHSVTPDACGLKAGLRTALFILSGRRVATCKTPHKIHSIYNIYRIYFLPPHLVNLVNPLYFLCFWTWRRDILNTATQAPNLFCACVARFRRFRAQHRDMKTPSLTTEHSITKSAQADNFLSSARCELDVVGVGVRRGEGDQSVPLFGQRGDIFLGQSCEGLDCEGSCIAASDDFPGRLSEAIDQRDAWHRAIHSEALFVVCLGDEAGPVGVGEQQIVVIVSSTSARPAATRSSMSNPIQCRPKEPFVLRSMTDCVRGRSQRQSRAVTR